MAARRAEQQQRALQERQCFPDNHTAPVPQDRARPWAATTQQLSVQEEVRTGILLITMYRVTVSILIPLGRYHAAAVPA